LLLVVELLALCLVLLTLGLVLLAKCLGFCVRSLGGLALVLPSSFIALLFEHFSLLVVSAWSDGGLKICFSTYDYLIHGNGTGLFLVEFKVERGGTEVVEG
jgi:hypothetical protein